MNTTNGIATGRKQLVTISVPVLDEAANIDPLIERLRTIASQNDQYDFEFLFTDNASTDRTFEKLAEWAQVDSRLRVLRLTRNFGFQRSILINLINARGDAAIQIDADLQDPPELISSFLKKWQEGYKVVYGIRRRRIENNFMRVARKVHYRLLSALSETPVPLDAGDFRLVDRVIIEHLKTFTDQSPYLRGLIASLGYPQIGIPYDRSARVRERSKFNLPKLITLSIDGICSQSTKPLHYITTFGFVTSILVIILGIMYLLAHLFSPRADAPGFTTLVILVLASICINSACIGLLGEYIGRIYNNVRGGPIAIIGDRIENLSSEEENTK